jgi:hypothetical protein
MRRRRRRGRPERRPRPRDGRIARLPGRAPRSSAGDEGYAVDAVVRASGLGARVSLLADVTDAEFLGWLSAADVAVDLRFPHRGEVSGSLARAMQCGRATVVSGTGTYLDVPAHRVVHVSTGRVDPEELAAAFGRLLDDRTCAPGSAGRARAHAVARDLGLRSAVRGSDRRHPGARQDPTRRALARWAGALVDMGLTEADLDRGYGTAYARALDGCPARGGAS